MNQLKTILTILLAFGVLSGWAADAKILAQSKGSISFVVDENLKEVEQSFFTFDGEYLAERLIVDENVGYQAHHIIASSFADENKLVYHGKDAFYRCIVKASLWKVPDGYRFMLEKNENRESINKEDLIKL